MEVNASDERSANVFEDYIRRAMESTTMKFQPSSTEKENQKGNKNAAKLDYGKPNCLILDEIDGVDAKGAIQALVDMARAEIPAKNAKHKKTYLRRPIICICNHKYAPALRPLLPYAVQFNVDPPSTARLVARLKGILNQERLAMMAGGSLLHQLVLSTGGDIRSCLFTLQFAAAQAEDDKDLSNALAGSLSGTGLKDDRSDIASTTTAIFRKDTDRSSGGGKILERSSGDASGGRSSVSRVVDCVEGFSDDSAVVNVLFMNLLRVSYIDPTLDRSAAAHELLSAADSYGGTDSPEHYTMQKICTPPMAAGIHLLCRVDLKPNLTFSTRELSDTHYRKEANQGLVQKFSEGLPAKSKNLKCASQLAEEFIPLSLWILSAGEGPSSLCRAASSIGILSVKERETVNAHIAAMQSLGLTYLPDHEFQEASQKPSYRAGAPIVEMRLEPPIHRLVQYKSAFASGRHRLNEIPSAMKELLAHQIRQTRFLNQGSARKETNLTATLQTGVESNPPLTPRKNQTSICNGRLETPATTKATSRKLEHLPASATIPQSKRIKVCFFILGLSIVTCPEARIQRYNHIV
jgi:chromosome transmission fidelity protein 18